MSEPASPRDELVTLLTSPQHAPMNDHHPETGGCMSCPWPMHMLPPEEIADVLIAAGYRHIPTLNLLHEDDTREKKTCDKAVKIQAVRSCCGRVDQFCMDCYNAVCAFHASKDYNSTSTHYTHTVTGRPFSQVNFI